MNKIDELIQQLCPNGVVYMDLGDVVNILDNLRKPISKSNREKGKYPYYGANGIQDYVRGFIFDGTFLLMGEDGSVINNDNSPILNWATGKIWVNNHAHVLSERKNVALLRFIYYYLSTIDVSLIVHGTPPKINQANLRSIIIPIPPLEIQEEIVRILDNFTKLEAELEAELEARNKQYEYYRNKLLSFEGKDVEWKSLGEICISITAGGDLPRKYTKNQKIPSIEFPYPIFANSTESKGLYGFTDNYTIDSCAVTIAARGAKVGFHLIREPYFTPIVRLIVLIPNLSIIATKYLNFALDITPISGTKGSIPQLIVPAVKKIIIPVPTLSEQQRIVEILEKFDSLVNNISVGLPAEIEARRKQYEYYRGKLLSFKEINNV